MVLHDSCYDGRGWCVSHLFPVVEISYGESKKKKHNMTGICKPDLAYANQLALLPFEREKNQCWFGQSEFY